MLPRHVSQVTMRHPASSGSLRNLIGQKSRRHRNLSYGPHIMIRRTHTATQSRNQLAGVHGECDEQDARQESVEMYIANADISLPLDLQSWSDEKPETRQRLRVAPPRHQSILADNSDTVQQRVPSDATRALRAELGFTGAELKSKTAELKQAKQLLKGKDKEIALLRASLVDRDARLQSSKAELVQARRDLQEKDEELRSAYAHMTKACEQRAAVRAALIGTQTELAETQAELDAWTHELATFQEDMANSLGEDTEVGTLAQHNGIEKDEQPSMRQGAANGSAADTRGGAADMRRVLHLLQNLSQLSGELKRDAKEDDRIFRDGTDGGN